MLLGQLVILGVLTLSLLFFSSTEFRFVNELSLLSNDCILLIHGLRVTVCNFRVSEGYFWIGTIRLQYFRQRFCTESFNGSVAILSWCWGMTDHCTVHQSYDVQ